MACRIKFGNPKFARPQNVVEDVLQPRHKPVQETDRSSRHGEHPLPEDQVPVLAKFLDLYQDLFLHDGYGELKVRMRFLKKGQKEILLQFGKEYRFVVDFSKASSWD